MAKAPHRPARKPAAGGALPSLRPRKAQPRNSQGVFVTADDPTAVPPSAPSVKNAIADKPKEMSVEAPDKPPTRKRGATPAQLVARVTRAIESELSQIEDIMNGAKVSAAKRTEAEKRARTLASLSRTLAEVTRLRESAKEARADHDTDAVPRDLDEFRRTLERRLAQIVDPTTLAPDRGDEPG